MLLNDYEMNVVLVINGSKPSVKKKTIGNAYQIDIDRKGMRLNFLARID